METSEIYSFFALDSLNLDCLLTVFQHLPLLDLLRLRYQCRSLNDAVCEFLRRSCRKLELNLDADRSGDDLERVIHQYNWQQYSYYSITLNVNLDEYDDIPEIRTITHSDTNRLHSHLFKNQPHFRCEDMIQVNSAEGATDRKVDSLVHFLTTFMPNLRELALLISHEDYFRSLARLLDPLRKLKVFFIDASCSIKEGYGRCNYPSTEIVEAICALPELESLYYFRNFRCENIFCYDAEDCEAMKDLYPPYFPVIKVDPHRLSNSENFLKVLLPRLRVLHCHYFTFPVGMTFDKVEEMSIGYHMADSVTQNYFPAVQTLSIDSPLDFYSQLADGRLSFVNVKVLKLVDYYCNPDSPFSLYSRTMEALNDLPNLEELHCRYVCFVRAQQANIVERNNTIVRLYSQHLSDQCLDCQNGSHPEPANCIETSKKIEEYVSLCKKFFRGLQLFTNENPPIVRHFS